jgi:hypothetical protein
MPREHSSLFAACALFRKPPRNFFRGDLQDIAVFDHDGVLTKTHFSFESCICGLTKAAESILGKTF